MSSKLKCCIKLTHYDHIVYLVGLHIHYKMIHGPYNVKEKQYVYCEVRTEYIHMDSLVEFQRLGRAMVQAAHCRLLTTELQFRCQLVILRFMVDK